MVSPLPFMQFYKTILMTSSHKTATFFSLNFTLHDPEGLATRYVNYWHPEWTPESKFFLQPLWVYYIHNSCE